MTGEPSRSGTTPPVPARLSRVRSLTRLLDTAVRVPGTRFRIGLDPILGLVPWAGDVLGAALSAYLIWQSARLGAPRATLVRMLSHVALEAVVGVIPVLGDVFDATFKANSRNLRLLERHVSDPEAAGAASKRFWVLLAGFLVAALLGIAVFSGWVLLSVLRAAGLA